jgi:hypothetical protein
MFCLEQDDGAARAINWHNSFPFMWRGCWWLTGVTTDFTSGGAYGNPQQFVARLGADLQSISGRIESVLVPNVPSGETSFDAVANLVEYQGDLYGAYVASGGTDPSVGGPGGGKIQIVKVAA